MVRPLLKRDSLVPLRRFLYQALLEGPASWPLMWLTSNNCRHLPDLEQKSLGAVSVISPVGDARDCDPILGTFRISFPTQDLIDSDRLSQWPLLSVFLLWRLVMYFNLPLSTTCDFNLINSRSQTSFSNPRVLISVSYKS